MDIGSGDRGNLTFLDIVSLMSFVIGLQNLDLNASQNDLAMQTQDINKAADKLVREAIADIHAHLERQDKKIEEVLKYIHENH